MKKSITIIIMQLLITANILNAQKIISSTNNEVASLLASALVHTPELTGSNYYPAQLEEIPQVSFNQTNVIRFFIPSESEWVFISVFNADGIEILTTCLTSKGLTEIPVNANTLKPGNYIASLIIDEKTLDSKQLIVTK